MITHVSLVDPDAVSAELVDAQIGAPDPGRTLVLAVGPHLRISMTEAAAEAIAEAIIETLAYAGDPVSVPAAYVPGWERV